MTRKAARHTATAARLPSTLATASASNSEHAGDQAHDAGADPPPRAHEPQRPPHPRREGDQQQHEPDGVDPADPVADRRQHGGQRPRREQPAALGLRHLREADDVQQQHGGGGRHLERHLAGHGKRGDDVDERAAGAHQHRREGIALVPGVVEHDQADQPEPGQERLRPLEQQQRLAGREHDDHGGERGRAAHGAGRQRPLGPLAQVDLVVEDVVEDHPAGVEERHRHRHDGDRAGLGGGRGEHRARHAVGDHGRRVRDARELEPRLSRGHRAPTRTRARSSRPTTP